MISIDPVKAAEIISLIPVEPDYSTLRLTAFKTESDPLFFMEQRGEVPSGAWLAKIAEIKDRYPKP